MGDDADPNDPGIVNLLELSLSIREELAAAASNHSLKPFQKERLERLIRNLDTIIDRAENPGDDLSPEALAEGVNTVNDKAVALVAEYGFDMDSFAAINEDALAIVTGQPADPGIGLASEIIIGRVEPGLLRNLQMNIAAEVLLMGGGQRDYQERLLAEMERQGIAPPESFTDAPVRYAEMVSRTLFGELQRARTEQRARSAGIQFGQISDHGALDGCRFSEGVVFTWPWASRAKGYPTRDEVRARNPHLFHPNCKHVEVNYVPDLVDEQDRLHAERAAADWNKFSSMSDEERAAAIKAANNEARDAMAEAWDGEATEEGA